MKRPATYKLILITAMVVGTFFVSKKLTVKTTIADLPLPNELPEPLLYSPNTCTKKKDIAFLKAHKCGSTTVSNILQRFGLRENANFVLPNKTKHQFWVLGKLSSNTFKEIIPLPKGEVHNILSVDTVFNKSIYQQLIPNNPFFLTIMREPVERFVSKAYYSYLLYKKSLKDGPYPFHQTEIKMTYGDFVLDASEGMEHLLKEMDNNFDFVMITEYFDESLILLRYRLCWSTKDIIYIIRNVNLKKKDYALSPEDRKLIEKLQDVYKNVYDHFKKKLFQEIISHGVDFLDELDNFKTILKEVTDYCNYPTGQKLQIPSSKWDKEFSINQSDCKLMNLKEVHLVTKLQKRQHKKFVDGHFSESETLSV